MSEWAETTLSALLTRVKRKVSVEPGIEYPAVSVLKDGQGLGPKAPFVGGVTNYDTLYLVSAGDVVLRTITAFESPVGVARRMHEGAHVSGVFITYEVGDSVRPDFLRLVFQSQRFQEQMRNRATGTVLRRKTIGDPSFGAITVPHPPLDEQRRIVDVVAAVDTQIRALSGECAAESKFLAARRAELFGAGISDTPSSVRLAFDVLMGRQRAPQHAEGPHMTNYVRSANVGNGSLDLGDIKQMNFTPSDQAKFGLRPGDVLVSEGSASAKAVGMSAVWRGEIEGVVCFQKTLLRFRAVAGVTTPEFVRHWCQWAYESGTFLDISSGTNIKHITAVRVLDVPVALPSLTEQTVVTAELDALAKHRDLLGSELATLRTFRSALLSSLLSQEVEIPASFDALLSSTSMEAVS
jgi:type I restriction enzyme S subunit